MLNQLFGRLRAVGNRKKVTCVELSDVLGEVGRVVWNGPEDYVKSAMKHAKDSGFEDHIDFLTLDGYMDPFCRMKNLDISITGSGRNIISWGGKSENGGVFFICVSRIVVLFRVEKPVLLA